MTISKKTLLATVVASLTLVAAGCGSSDDKTAAGNSTDRAFVAEMIPHHESAVDMAKVAEQRGTSPFVKQLAADIVRTQNEEISTMRSEDAELADAGVDVGRLGVSMDEMGMGMDTASLETADPFDPAFLKMMLPHHSGAVKMARLEIEKGEDPELKKLAEAIISAQEREIKEMRENL